MKKITAIAGLVLILVLGSAIPAAGRSRHLQPAKNFLTFSFVINPSQLGYKHHMGKNLYATGDLLYQQENSELLFRVGGAYFLPVKVLFFRFYGSTGYQFARNNGNEFPYVAVGTHFWFLFSEVLHPLENRASPEYRLGFSVRF
jgi:hypothetical protein